MLYLYMLANFFHNSVNVQFEQYQLYIYRLTTIGRQLMELLHNINIDQNNKKPYERLKLSI